MPFSKQKESILSTKQGAFEIQTKSSSSCETLHYFESFETQVVVRTPVIIRNRTGPGLHDCLKEGIIFLGKNLLA